MTQCKAIDAARVSTAKKRKAAAKRGTATAAEIEKAKDYVASLSPSDAAAVSVYQERVARVLRVPKLLAKAQANGNISITIDHDDEALGWVALNNAFGVSSIEASNSIINQLLQFTTHRGEPDQKQLNFAVKSIAEIGPNDPVESMLAVQMVATHLAAIRQLRMLQNSETLPQFDANERATNKLLRSFAAQTEALRKYRGGGKQTVEVRHVHVNEGGQAIIGNVDAGGGREPKN